MENDTIEKVVKQGYAAALAMQVRRDHSKLELRHKLSHKGYDSDVVEMVLDKLIDDRLLDEHRFAEAYLRSRVGKGYGPERIRMELKDRGVDSEIIQEVLDAQDNDWYELARQAYLKKYGDRQCQNFNEIAKRRRFLMQRGYNHDQQKYAMSDEN